MGNTQNYGFALFYVFRIKKIEATVAGLGYFLQIVNKSRLRQPSRKDGLWSNETHKSQRYLLKIIEKTPLRIKSNRLTLYINRTQSRYKC